MMPKYLIEFNDARPNADVEALFITLEYGFFVLNGKTESKREYVDSDIVSVIRIKDDS